MKIETLTERGALVVVVTGRLDAVTAPAYVERLREELAGGARRLVMDCSGLEYVSSAGLRAILLVSKDLTRIGGTEVYCGLQQQAMEIFKMSGFASIIQIHDTRDTALQSLSQAPPDFSQKQETG